MLKAPVVVPGSDTAAEAFIWLKIRRWRRLLKRVPPSRSLCNGETCEISVGLRRQGRSIFFAGSS